MKRYWIFIPLTLILLASTATTYRWIWANEQKNQKKLVSIVNSEVAIANNMQNNAVSATESISKMAQGETQELKRISLIHHFDSQKLALGEDRKLFELAEFLKDNPDCKIEIVGHSDVTGSYTYNQELSKKRSQEIQNLLQGLGIDAGKISTRFVGHEEPLVDNGSKLGRKINRRSDILVIKESM